MTFISSFQNTMSRAQAFPILGPVVVSPIKALVSTIELVIGIAGTILFGALTSVTFFIIPPVGFAGLAMTYLSFNSAQEGSRELLYSIVNILSLGILGYLAEDLQQSL